MKRNLKKYRIIVLLTLNCIMAGLYANSSEIDKDSLPDEQLYMISDRDIYCADEIIHIKVYELNSQETKELNWSNIVYCDLITPDGRSVAKDKFKVSENCADGNLYIPKNVISGNYYLRTYTKWMRNQSPYSFNFKQVKVINPFTSEVLTNVVSISENVKIQNSEKEKNNFISIEKQDSTFSRNDSIQLRIIAKCNDCFQKSMTISVVKKGTNHYKYQQIRGFDKNINEVKYIPETREVSLSGKIVNKSDSLPVPNANVWITLLTEEPVTREVFTDSNGNFNFDLGTYYGKYDLFIQANTLKKNIEPVVCVDNDFSYTKLNLPFIPFEISDSDRELYENMMVNSQLQNIFKKDKTAPDSIKFSYDKLFYGKPDFVLKLDNFIELPTVEDYIRELLPNVRIKKEETKHFFKLYGSNPDMAFYDPLVMVNLIKFNDVDNILELSPKLIDRVELIEVPFIRGEMTYGGIIHFITKTADFSNINFPDGSVFVEYDMISKNENSIIHGDCPNLPIIGNCLYWNPSLRLKNGKETTCRFNSGSEIGEYEIVIEGLDKNNKPFQVRDSFIVK